MFQLVFVALLAITLLAKQNVLAFICILMLFLNAFYNMLKTQSDIMKDIAKRNEAIRESNRKVADKKRRETTQMPVSEIVKRLQK